MQGVQIWSLVQVWSHMLLGTAKKIFLIKKQDKWFSLGFLDSRGDKDVTDHCPVVWAVNTEFEATTELASKKVYVKPQQETVFSNLRKYQVSITWSRICWRILQVMVAKNMCRTEKGLLDKLTKPVKM